MTRDEAIVWMVNNRMSVVKDDLGCQWRWNIALGCFECYRPYFDGTWLQCGFGTVLLSIEPEDIGPDGRLYHPVDSPEDEKKKRRMGRITRILASYERTKEETAENNLAWFSFWHDTIEEMIREALTEEKR